MRRSQPQRQCEQQRRGAGGVVSRLSRLAAPMLPGPEFGVGYGLRRAERKPVQSLPARARPAFGSFPTLGYAGKGYAGQIEKRPAPYLCSVYDEIGAGHLFA